MVGRQWEGQPDFLINMIQPPKKVSEQFVADVFTKQSKKATDWVDAINWLQCNGYCSMAMHYIETATALGIIKEARR